MRILNLIKYTFFSFVLFFQNIAASSEENFKNNDFESITTPIKEQNFDTNDTNNENETKALFTAIALNNIDDVKKLLAMPNIDVNYIDENELTALIIAIEFENIDILKLLLLKPEINLSNVLSIAIFKKNLEIIKILLNQPTVDVNETITINLNNESSINISPIIVAININDIEIIKALLETKKIVITQELLDFALSEDNESDNKTYSLLLDCFRQNTVIE